MSTTRNNPFNRLIGLLSLDRPDIIQVYGYAVLNGVVTLTLPIGIQAIINLIQGGLVSTAWIVLVGFVLLGTLFTGIFQLMQLRIVESIAQKLFTRSSFEFAFRLPSIRNSAMRDHHAPELTNRFFDTITIQKALPKILIDFSISLFQIIIGLFVLSFYHSFFIIYGFLLIFGIVVIIMVTGPAGLQTSLDES